MHNLSEQRIRERAYQLWEAAGEPREHMDLFWYQAERELIAEGRAPDGKGQTNPRKFTDVGENSEDIPRARDHAAAAFVSPGHAVRR